MPPAATAEERTFAVVTLDFGSGFDYGRSDFSKAAAQTLQAGVGCPVSENATDRTRPKADYRAQIHQRP